MEPASSCKTRRCWTAQRIWHPSRNSSEDDFTQSPKPPWTEETPAFITFLTYQSLISLLHLSVPQPIELHRRIGALPDVDASSERYSTPCDGALRLLPTCPQNWMTPLKTASFRSLATPHPCWPKKMSPKFQPLFNAALDRGSAKNRLPGPTSQRLGFHLAVTDLVGGRGPGSPGLRRIIRPPHRSFEKGPRTIPFVH
ncbi:hypothetical protein CMUS01_13603 [Colletotrichum musicola]|uniref:Uncharacterized protein n=1 Tax=Colletotrichum musicola TaxID=2175873 RepID=A0A8H6JC05_9PEZI|nr:hypothetical protein CMUS01_13603 [Colletotrichum musicola]